MNRRQQGEASDITLMALFARMDTVAMAIAVATVFALGLAAATVVLLLQGAPAGMPVGPNLSALGNVLPGYSVTWIGALIGAAWAGLIGLVVGFLGAAVWNFIHLVFLGLLALGYPRAPTPSLQGGLSMTRPLSSNSEDRGLFLAAARLNVAIAFIGVGMGLGILLFVATHISLGVSAHPGRYLNLLGVFMPGYSVSSAGAWFGLLWGFIYGGVSAGAIAWFYMRTLGAKLPRLAIWDESAIIGLRSPVLRVSNHALGMALGVIAALQLVLATMWLVLRGTADQSTHAKLLSHYLPGYSVSLPGSLIGGFELFLVVYLFSSVIGAIYNAIALRRGGGSNSPA